MGSHLPVDMVFPRLYPSGLFSAFDVNCDSHIDLSEMVNAVALCCRKPEEERHRCEYHRRLCGRCMRGGNGYFVGPPSIFPFHT